MVCALDPDFENIECSEDVEDFLIEKGAIIERTQRNKKISIKYMEIAGLVAQDFTNVCNTCTEANRFKCELEIVMNNPL